MLQELHADLNLADVRGSIRDRLREYCDAHRDARPAAERADCAWRIVQNVLAEELSELNAGLDAGAQILEKDRLALPDGSQAIDIVYHHHKFSIVRPKDRRQLALVDPCAGTLPIEHVGSKLFIAGEPIGPALLRAVARLVERATAGVNSQNCATGPYMTLELWAGSAAKVEAALNLAHQNGYRFMESYACSTPQRRVFVFERHSSVGQQSGNHEPDVAAKPGNGQA